MQRILPEGSIFIIWVAEPLGSATDWDSDFVSKVHFQSETQIAILEEKTFSSCQITKIDFLETSERFISLVDSLPQQADVQRSVS